MGNTELTLRAIEPSDVDFLFEAESDPDASRWSDYVAPLSREQLLQYALSYDADPFRAGQLRMILDLDGSPIGIVDLFFISPRHLRADTGIYILPSARGKGLASKALLLLKQYALQRLGLHQLNATVAEQNTPSLRAYASAGFQTIGQIPDWFRISSDTSPFSSALLLSSILDN